MPGAANIYKMRKAAKDKDELVADKKKPKKKKNIRARPVTLTTTYAKKKNIRSKPKSRGEIAKAKKEKNIKQQTCNKVSKPKHPAHTKKSKTKDKKSWTNIMSTNKRILILVSKIVFLMFFIFNRKIVTQVSRWILHI